MSWIAVDLDGTLAYYHGFLDPYTIGDPIPSMIEEVQKHLRMGVEIRIFTARIDSEALRRYREQTGDKQATPENVVRVIEEWSKKHIGRVLKVTDRKDLETIAIWDDIAARVVRNTGKFRAEENKN